MNPEALGRIIGLILGGAVFGLIPFYVGKKKGRERLGLAGLVVSALSTLVLAVYAVFIPLVFAAVIWKLPEGQADGPAQEVVDRPAVDDDDG